MQRGQTTSEYHLRDEQVFFFQMGNKTMRKKADAPHYICILSLNLYTKQAFFYHFCTENSSRRCFRLALCFCTLAGTPTVIVQFESLTLKSLRRGSSVIQA